MALYSSGWTLREQGSPVLVSLPPLLYKAHPHWRIIANTLELPTRVRVTIPGWYKDSSARSPMPLWL